MLCDQCGKNVPFWKLHWNGKYRYLDTFRAIKKRKEQICEDCLGWDNLGYKESDHEKLKTHVFITRGLEDLGFEKLRHMPATPMTQTEMTKQCNLISSLPECPDGGDWEDWEE